MINCPFILLESYVLKAKISRIGGNDVVIEFVTRGEGAINGRHLRRSSYYDQVVRTSSVFAALTRLSVCVIMIAKIVYECVVGQMAMNAFDPQESCQ